MIHQQREQGGLFAVVVVILIAALISFLGFIFWMKYVDMNESPTPARVGSLYEQAK